MLKIYEQDGLWYVELTELNNYMVGGKTIQEAICKFCDTLKCFLIESYRRDKLDKILDDQNDE